LLKALKLDKLLDRVPGLVWEPLFERIWHIRVQRAVNKEVHLRHSVGDLKESLLHKSECQHRQEDLLMAFEESTRDPLVDCDSDHQDQVGDADFQLFCIWSLIDGLEEERCERLKRVLIHVINDPKLDQQEVEHSALSSDWPIRFS
jgi:hypothetical protein